MSEFWWFHSEVSLTPLDLENDLKGVARKCNYKRSHRDRISYRLGNTYVKLCPDCIADFAMIYSERKEYSKVEIPMLQRMEHNLFI